MQLFCSHSHTRSLPFSHLLPNFRYTFTTPFHCSLIVFFVSAVSHMSNICPTSPYKDMGRYSSKEWKIKEKVTKYFSVQPILHIADDKSSIKCNFKNKMPARKGKITGNYLFNTITFHCSIEVPLRTRVHARLPTAMLIFCCHKCHTRRKIPRENSSKLSKIAEISPKTKLKTHLFRCIFKLISDGHTPHLLKHIHTRIITH